MFGIINGKDAQGLMEDMAILNANRARLENGHNTQQQMQREHASSQEQANSAMVGAVVAIKVRDNKIQEMEDRLNNTRTGWFNSASAAAAGSDALKAAAVEIAKLSGRSINDVMYGLNSIRSRVYDQEINEYLKKGSIKDDPRANQESLPNWYVKDSCVL